MYNSIITLASGLISQTAQENQYFLVNIRQLLLLG